MITTMASFFHRACTDAITEADGAHGSGGIPTFLRWRNLPADSPKDYGPFYDLSSDVYSDFTDFVRQLITHRSNITGVSSARTSLASRQLGLNMILRS